MRNKMLKLSGAAAACWDDPAALWSQANGSAGDATPVAAAAPWAAYCGPSLDLGVGGGAVNGHAGWAFPVCSWRWALKTSPKLCKSMLLNGAEVQGCVDIMKVGARLLECTG